MRCEGNKRYFLWKRKGRGDEWVGTERLSFLGGINKLIRGAALWKQAMGQVLRSWGSEKPSAACPMGLSGEISFHLQQTQTDLQEWADQMWKLTLFTAYSLKSFKKFVLVANEWAGSPQVKVDACWVDRLDRLLVLSRSHNRCRWMFRLKLFLILVSDVLSSENLKGKLQCQWGDRNEYIASNRSAQ